MRNLRKSGKKSFPGWGKHRRGLFLGGCSWGVVPGNPPGKNRESCFLLNSAENGTLILGKNTTPDFKTFSQEKKEMKKQKKKNNKKKTL